MNKRILFLFFACLLASCKSLGIGLTSTPIPTKTSSPVPSPSATLTPLPTSTFTQAPTLPPGLPEIPNGFTWKIVEETQIGFPIPDGWFYKEEKEGNTSAYFATKENIDEVGEFSTGMTINLIKDESINAVAYAELLIRSIVEADTTKKVIGDWHYTQEHVISFQAQIEAEFADKPLDDPNRNKTIHYIATADTHTNILYFIIFESPTPLWEDEWEKGGIMMQLAILNQ